MGTGQPAEVLQRFQDVETAGSRFVESSERDRVVLDDVDAVEQSGGGYLCSREGAQVLWQRGGMAQLVFDKSLRWGR